MTEQNNDIRNTFGGIAEQYHQLRRRVEKIERSPADLRNAAIDGGRGLTIKSDAETIRFGDNGVEHLEGPAPEKPEAPFVDLGGESVKIQLSGLDAYGYPAQRNFKQAHIHVSQDDVFEPSRGTFAGYVAQADGSMTHRLPGGEWYVGVVWESMSGALSPMSDATLADVEPLVNTDDIEEALGEAQERLDEYTETIAKPRFEELETGLGENAENLTAAEKRLSAAESTLSPLPGRISEAEENVETAKEAAVEAGAAAVEANNRSMTRLANGNFENGLDYWAYQDVTLDSTAHSGSQAALLDASGWLRPESSFPVTPDQIWELSLYHQHDVSVEFQAVDGGTRTTLETFHLDGDTAWEDSGALRVTVPAGVDMLSFTITGDSALVDDITLRDVTDVVRLEEAANANRQKAEQAISELAVLQLAVDGEGGLKDRLASAETVLETKADESALDQLDQKLAGDLAQIEAHYSKVWRQPTPPPSGVHYAWLGEPHASASVRFDGDGNETARNEIVNGDFENGIHGWSTRSGTLESQDSFNHQMWGGLGGSMGYLVADIDTRYADLHQYFAAVEAGTWIGISALVANDRDVEHRLQITWRGHESSDWSTTDWGNYEYYDGIHHHAAFQAPFDCYDVRLQIQLDKQIGDERQRLWADKVAVAFADSEQNALDQVAEYWDGSTESDRAHDLWYNGDGVPHEWVNGQGWVVLDDQRLAELQDGIDAAMTAAGSKSKVTYSTSAPAGTATVGDTHRQQNESGDIIGEWEYTDDGWQKRQVSSDAISNLDVGKLTAGTTEIVEAVINKLWAELGVFGRLEAREGWVGGVNLADGAVTAEKIEATREMITKIMGAEWAYISERLVVDGEIVTANLTAISAAMRTLTVTDRADFAQAFAEEMWASLGVFTRLQAEEAWIGGALIKDDTIDVAKINVTEQLTAAIAQFLEIEAGMIKANAVDADAIAAGAIETDHLNGRIIKGENIQGDTFTGETFDGGTFTGSTFQTDSLPNHGLKFGANGIHGWNDNGQKTLQITGELAEDITNPDAGNFLTGRFYTNGAGKPGAILNPDYGPDSKQGPGIWFSQTGWVESSQPAIWAEKVPGETDGMWWLNIRSKREDNGGRNPIRMIGGVDVQEGGLLVGYTIINDDGTIDAGKDLSVWGTSYFHGTLRYPGKIERTGSSNVQIYSSWDNFAKITSVRASKINIEDVKHDRPERILDLQPRIWLDRTDLKEALGDDYSDYVWAGNQYSGPTVDEEKLKNKLGYIPRRIPGLVAEEVVAAGLDEYAIYDEEEDGTETLQSISYDRLWTLLIPLVREQRDNLAAQEERLSSQKERISDLEERLTRLEAKL